jgi:hypothetical protein
MSDGESIVQRAGVVDGEHNVYTEAALAANDDKTVPLRDRPGGRVIGTAHLRYDAGEKALKARFEVDDPKVAEILREDPPSIFG